ncbi:MAG: divergent polysaccharide deacetylase family protein [Thermoanaerobaculia bacterium]
MSGRRKRGRPGAVRRAALVLAAVAALAAGVFYCRGRERVSPPPAKAPRVGPAAPRPEPRPSGVPSDFESVGKSGAGVVAVVLDDLGYDEQALAVLGRWEGPLAVAVIPGTPHAARAAALANEKKWDLLVHLPMEPESGPSEAESIGTRDDDAVIRARILAALAKVPGAIGVNNHQGSKATADPRVMRAVLAVVKEQGLFFLDSRTTNASVAARQAASLGVPFLARDVFLDDVAAEAAAKGGVPEALDAAWKRALDVAAKNGQVILLGHPRKETLAFLGPKLEALEKNQGRGAAAKAVRVSELVP